MGTHLLWAALHFSPNAADTVLANVIHCWHVQCRNKLSYSVSALFGKRKKDIFSEREIHSTLQKYLLPVKRRPSFSAAIQRICLETVIHSDWYYALFLCFAAVLDFNVWEIKRTPPPRTICHSVFGVLTVEMQDKMKYGIRIQSIWQEISLISSANACRGSECSQRMFSSFV